MAPAGNQPLRHLAQQQQQQWQRHRHRHRQQQQQQQQRWLETNELSKLGSQAKECLEDEEEALAEQDRACGRT